MKKMLIVDDNEQMVDVLKVYAKREGYNPISAFDGEEALEKFGKEKPDVILLDVMLPKKNGYDVCKMIRKNSNVPILMITARDDDYDKIMGLEIGADDYIVKPFSGGEIMARVRAIFRRIERVNDNSDSIFCYGNLKIDPNAYSVFLGSEKIPLTKKEFELLWILAPNSQKVFSRESLLDMLWGKDYFGDRRIIDKHIQRLRTKLEGLTGKAMTIKAVRGRGYKFETRSDVEK